jgi:signal transduction histidine kinase/CheY-like chemotaxis protein
MIHVPTEEQDETCGARNSFAEFESARAEQEPRQSPLKNRLLAAQKYEALAVLTGGVAHDFNNILVGIIGFASLAREAMERDHPAQEYIEKIELAGERAAELTAQMLAYSEHGRLEVTDIHFDRVVEEMAELAKSAISKEAVLDLRLGAPHARIEGDVAQLRQVVMNLLTNASEALEQDPGVITVRTSIVETGSDEVRDMPEFASLDPGSYVFFEVSDTGVGINEENQHKIFDPFFSTKFTGRGLGLAAVVGIMREHRGAIRVASTPGCGSDFQVVLPLCVRNPRETAVESAKLHCKAQRRETVLIIDDEEFVRGAAAAVLREGGFKVILAEDGLEGIECFRKNADEISCVLLDLTMPRLSGAKVLAQLRVIRPDVRVLLTSGYDQSTALADLTDKPTSFLNKPFTADRLIQQIRAVTLKAE